MKIISLKQTKILIAYAHRLDAKERIYCLLLFIAIIGSLLSTLSAVYTGPFGPSLLAVATCFLYLLLLGIYTLHTKNTDRSALWLCLGFCFLIFPLNYIYSGGNTGGMPVYFIIGIYGINMLSKLKLRFLLSLLSLAVYSGLILYCHYHPELIVPFPEPLDASIDLIVSIAVASFMIGTSMNAIWFAYYREHKKVLLLNRQLKAMAFKDPLTSLYNRRHLHSQLVACIEMAHEQQTPLSIIIFDVDFFKSINDTYGHLVGDEALGTIADVMRRETRSHDIVGRYGGEEFLLILFDTNTAKASQIAERIRRAVAEMKIPPKNISLTISGGIGFYATGMSPNDLIAVADENLYRAKCAGRNQIISA